MSLKSPTTQTVASAIAYHRELRGVTRDEFSYLLSVHCHELTPDKITLMERGERDVTVDDLIALSFVLDVTPNDLLCFVPMPPSGTDGGPIATGLPDDLAPAELADWLSGRLRLDDASRAQWWQEQEARLEILSAHLEDQLGAAIDELHDLGELEDQETDARSAERLHTRIRTGELAVHETGRELDVIGMRLDELRGPA